MTIFYTSVYVNTKILEHVLKNTAFSSTNAWLGLYTGIPTLPNTELTGNSYSRKQVAFTVSGSTAVNTSEIRFAQATGEWNNIAYYGISDSASSVNLLFYDRLPIPKKLYTGNTFVVNAGELYVGLGGGYSTYLAGKLLNHLLNNTTYTSPGLDVFSALYTALPDKNDSGGTEVNAVNYDRLKISGSGWSNITSISSYTTDSNNTGVSSTTVIDLIFCTDTQYSWGILDGLCLRDSNSGGNQLFRGEFTISPGVVVGDSYMIKTGDLVVQAS
jgi:hypothetical protein